MSVTTACSDTLKGEASFMSGYFSHEVDTSLQSMARDHLAVFIDAIKWATMAAIL